MSMDGFVITALQNELEQLLPPARVNKIFQPSPYEIVIHLRRPGENYRLLLSAHPHLARAHLTEINRENPAKPPHFCLLLRKHLAGSHLIAIKRPHFERILNFHFQTSTSLGDPMELILVLEVMGKYSNIILCEKESGKILDSMKRVTSSMSRYREIIPGLSYVFPPSQNKIDPRQVQELHFYSHLQASNEPLHQALIRTFAGIGPLLAKELLYRSALDPNTRPGELDRRQLLLLWVQFSDLMGMVENNKWEPVVVLDKDKDPLEFSFMPLLQFGGCQQLSCPGISRAADIYYDHQERQQVATARKQQILALIEKEMERLKNTITHQKLDLDAMGEGERFRHLGELLTANIFRISRGDRLITVDDYQSPAGTTVEIPLDPNLSPAANAQLYFRRYQKSKKGKPQLQQQLAKNRGDLSYLKGVALALGDAVTNQDIIEIEEELASQGYTKKHYKSPQRKNRRDKTFITPRPATYQSQDGFVILVGKNNRQNDYLTRHLAQEHDFWFHAQGIPGAHVIVRCPGGQMPPDTTLEDAALLAAYNSSDRWSNQVAVDYTRVKNVHKPKGARPGMVIYKQQKTIYVTPQRNVAEGSIKKNNGPVQY